MQGFYGSGVPSNMFQERPFPLMHPSLSGFSPNMQQANQMDAYKQQMMRLAGLRELQNSLLSVTSTNPFLPVAMKPNFPSFGTAAKGGRLIGGSNLLMNNTSELTPLAEVKHLAAMTSSGMFSTSGKTPVFPFMTQSAVSKNSLSQSLSSSPASSSNSSETPDNAVPSNSTSNLSLVVMQNENNIKLAEMMQKYQQVQAASRSFKSRVLPQQPGLLSNNVSLPGNTWFPSNGSFNPRLYNQYSASKKDFSKMH